MAEQICEFSSHQFGFRKGRTTEQAILNHIEHTGCPRTGSPEKTGMCRQQKRLQID
jgi:hypothetical protein